MTLLLHSLLVSENISHLFNTNAGPVIHQASFIMLKILKKFRAFPEFLATDKGMGIILPVMAAQKLIINLRGSGK